MAMLEQKAYRLQDISRIYHPVIQANLGANVGGKITRCTHEGERRPARQEAGLGLLSASWARFRHGPGHLAVTRLIEGKVQKTQRR